VTRRQLRESDPSVLRPRDRKLEDILPIDPTDDLIYIDPFEMRQTVGKENLIAMPEYMMDETPLAGRIFAMGAGRLRHIHKGDLCCWTRAPMSVEVGDFVFYPMFAATPFQYEVEGTIYEFVIIKEGHVFGTIDPAFYAPKPKKRRRRKAA